MSDREKVITHLRIIHTWAEFARKRDLQFFTQKHLEDIAQWSNDAIELLKEHDTQKFFVDENGKITPLPIVFPNCPLKKHEVVEPYEAEMMITHDDGTKEYIKDIDSVMLLAHMDYQIEYTGEF